MYNEFCKEAKKGSLYNSISKPKERVFKIMKKFISKRTMERYIAKTEDGTTSEPRQNEKKVSKLDDFDKQAIKRLICDMFKNKEVVSIRKLKHRVEEHLHIDVSKTTIWKTVRGLGFTFRKRTGLNKSILCERWDLVAARSKYLRLVRQRRQEGYDIVYLDETWVNAHHTKGQEWMSKDGSLGRNVPTSKGQRLIVAHAGSSNIGFVPECALIFQSVSTDNRDYHTEMNADVFKDWVEHKLLPQLKDPSCIVMDNASYHNFIAPEDKIPTSAWTKPQIISWLQQKDISFPEHALKAELLNIVKKQHIEKKYAIDQMIVDHGHTCLRLPPYHSHLNPIELIWAKIKCDAADKNTTFKLKDIEILIRQSMRDIDQAFWKKCVDHVIKEEDDYWRNDGLGFIQQQLVIPLSDSDSEMEMSD